MSYAEVLPGVDVDYRVEGASLKEVLVVKDRPDPGAPAVFRFPLSLSGLSPRNEPGGGVGLYDEAGRLSGRFPDGVVTDSASPPAQGFVDVSLAGTAGAWVLVVAPDAGFMADPARVLPLLVDPTLSGNEAPTSPGALAPQPFGGMAAAVVTTARPALSTAGGSDPDGGPAPLRTGSGCRTRTTPKWARS